LSGYLDLGDYRFHCWKHGGHGYVNFMQAVAGSCDTYFYDLGHRVGIDRIQAMAQRLGSARNWVSICRTNAQADTGPRLEARHQDKSGSKVKLSLPPSSGLHTCHPLQLATMAARLANGGNAVQPHVIKASGVLRNESRSLGFNTGHVISYKRQCPPW